MRLVSFIKDNDQKVGINPDNVTTIDFKSDKLTIINLLSGFNRIVQGSFEEVARKLQFGE